MPIAGNVAYAAAMSSGETASEPRPIEATGVSGDMWTFSRCAMFHTYRGPTSSVNCAYTVLSDWSVARVRDSEPEYEFSYVCTVQGSWHHGPIEHVNGADV